MSGHRDTETQQTFKDTHLIHFFRPTFVRVLLFIVVAALLLAVKSEGFSQRHAPSNMTAVEKESVVTVGYPFVYFVTSKKGSTNFHTRAILKNLGIYYLISCLLVAFVSYTYYIYRYKARSQKIFYTSILLYSLVGIMVTFKVVGGHWLNMAANAEHELSIKLLLGAGVSVDSLSHGGETSALILAARKNNTRLAKFLLENNANVNERNRYGRTALHVAVEKNSIEVARLLLKSGAHINAADYKKMLPVHFVRSYSMAQLLVDHKADLDAKNAYNISAIFYAPDDKTFIYFRKKGADFDLSLNDETKRYKDDLLRRTTSPKIIMMLVNANADINVRNENDETPLHKLVKLKGTGDAKVDRYIRTLVRRGADVNIRDKHKMSPFHYTIANCDVESAKWMYRKSIEVRRHYATRSWKEPFQKLIRDKKQCWDKIQEAAKDLEQKREKEKADRRAKVKQAKAKAAALAKARERKARKARLDALKKVQPVSNSKPLPAKATPKPVNRTQPPTK